MKKEKKEPECYCFDFETTVYSDKDLKELGLEEQTTSEVWSAAICKVEEHPTRNMPSLAVYNNIYQFMNHLENYIPDGSLLFVWNLKFDGSYLLNHLIEVENWTPCLNLENYDPEEEPETYGSSYDQRFQPYTYSCVISKMNQWYKISLRFPDKTIHILDAVKLIPLPLRKAAKAFNVKVQKEEMKYSGTQHKAFGPITAQELSYIQADVLSMSEILWKARELYGLKKMTIASCSLEFMKEEISEPLWEYYFPDLRNYINDSDVGDAFHFVQKSYHGGWCYCDKRNKGKTYWNGDENVKNLLSDKANIEKTNNIFCIDVNSLYPFALHSNEDRSNPHYYPVGEPVYKKGTPTQGEIDSLCIFRHIKCYGFELKDRCFPWLHIRNSNYYKANECLTTSKIMGKFDTLPNGEPIVLDLYFTQLDFELFLETYEVKYEDVDYIEFEREEGIFDGFIDKWFALKAQGKAEGSPLAQVAKLVINSSYGKLGSSLDSSSRFCYTDEEGVLKFRTHFASDKTPVAMAAASYCTSIAMNYTVRTAMKLYDNYSYSDTDSIHGYGLTEDELKKLVPCDPVKLGWWDIEVKEGVIGRWEKQKTYIEVVKDLDKEGKVVYNQIIKSAGLSDNGKAVLSKALSLDPSLKKTVVNIDDDEYEVPKMYVDDFTSGLRLKKVNLKAKQVKGGVLLVKDDFSLN